MWLICCVGRYLDIPVCDVMVKRNWNNFWFTCLISKSFTTRILNYIPIVNITRHYLFITVCFFQTFVVLYWIWEHDELWNSQLTLCVIGNDLPNIFWKFTKVINIVNTSSERFYVENGRNSKYVGQSWLVVKTRFQENFSHVKRHHQKSVILPNLYMKGAVP